jgi:hypothetical protein
MLSREDALYYENLLVIGFSEEYKEWLDSCLETEDPLSSVVLELSWCGSDYVKTISLLNSYRKEKQLDEASVCDRLRLFLKKAYHSGQMDKGQVVSAMYKIASHIGDPGDFDSDVWGYMFYLDEYYSLAEDGSLSWEKYDSAFFEYLDHGSTIGFDKIWGSGKRTTFIDRIKAIFKR